MVPIIAQKILSSHSPIKRTATNGIVNRLFLRGAQCGVLDKISGNQNFGIGKNILWKRIGSITRLFNL